MSGPAVAVWGAVTASAGTAAGLLACCNPGHGVPCCLAVAEALKPLHLTPLHLPSLQPLPGQQVLHCLAHRLLPGDQHRRLWPEAQGPGGLGMSHVCTEGALEWGWPTAAPWPEAQGPGGLGCGVALKPACAVWGTGLRLGRPGQASPGQERACWVCHSTTLMMLLLPRGATLIAPLLCLLWSCCAGGGAAAVL